ncbi:MAG: transporter substrate-binding domain-containing protein [Deltaproteobacteria bacterium]|nr:transporter substrate-binding domain-containing protein [Deltaproteobacteria bacterium]MCP4716829.1 transporter substrate-binding domain-containing protein [Deltaproteobacteria bacterium]
MNHNQFIHYHAGLFMKLLSSIIMATIVIALLDLPVVCSSTIEFSAKEKEYLSEKTNISMCIDPDWMPYEKIEDGEHIGMSADYVKLFSEKIGVPIRLVPTASWSESLSFAKARKCDILSLAMSTAERNKYMNFTKAYLEIPLVIATKPDEPFVSSFYNVIEKPLGIVKDYAFVEILKNKYPKINLREVENLSDGLEEVARGNLYGYVGSLASVGYALQKHYPTELKINGKFDEKWIMSISTRKDEPLLNDIFNRAIDSIDDKQHVEIMNSWTSVQYDQGINYTLVWRIIISSIVLLCLFGGYLWQINKRNILISNKNDELERVGAVLKKTNQDLDMKNKVLTKALEEVKTLSGLLPICAACKKIRDDHGYWNKIESYIAAHSEVDFTHSLCPECAKKLYPELYKDK